ncbi:unnamed protein product [Spirodela intermedia]|uniref:S-locus glycoprotein domain-containing protein n=1 Tax=Spirodela intermedia TaxID=51605 RepID=A0A7I8JP21_SPIIN|nr:unnamed protein product [Spirodela intermedia]CAA6671899.1 unnamed protein product [Spirodela intermedia]
MVGLKSSDLVSELPENLFLFHGGTHGETCDPVFGFLSVIGASSRPLRCRQPRSNELAEGWAIPLVRWWELPAGVLQPGVPAKRCLCIRFNRGNEKPVVWVANRESPLNGSDGILRFGEDGKLVPLDKTGNIVCSRILIRAPVATAWFGFWRPGTSEVHLQASGQTSTDHCSAGRDDVDLSPGFWNGVGFTGSPSHSANNFFNSSVVSSGDEVSYSYSLIAGTGSLRPVVTPSGSIKRYVWKDKADSWTLLWTAPAICESYRLCGPYGTCAESDYPTCRCLSDFSPKSPEEWQQGNWTGGCVRNTGLSCNGGDGFRAVEPVKLPALLNATVTEEMSWRTAGPRRVCVTWDGDLVDIMHFTSSGQVLLLRVVDANEVPSFLNLLVRLRSDV